MSLPERHEQTPPVGVKWHEYANVFPMLQGSALDALREDIRANGVREPIVFLGEYILDGRNRYQCARDLGIEYPRREFGSQESDGTDPLAFVVSHNLTRRHLTESQRAGAAARLANMERGDNQYSGSANLPTLPQAEAARMLNVSERSLRSAKAVQQSAPDIAPLVDDGSLSVSLASQVADLPPETREAIVSAAPDQRREVAREEVKKAHVAHNSGQNEWYTPQAIIDAARRVMGGIFLDPASSEKANETIGASVFFTKEDDGLSTPWPAGNVWMNPPYAQQLIGQFSEKMALEIEGGTQAIILVNNATETAWFQRMACVSSAICFPKSRIKFLDPEGNPGAPLQGQAIIYAGPNCEAFQSEFSAFGVVLRHE